MPRRRNHEWNAIADLIERVSGDAPTVERVVREVRSSVRAIASLEASDVSRHTRALLAASTRAVAERRGPSEAELAFVEDLAKTRARQGVPIHAVLAAIHVAERRFWATAREIAAKTGVDPMLLLQARELYDDWAQEVRARLMRVHAEASRAPEVAGAGEADRETETVRRLLQGGSAAALAAAAAGLSRDEVVVLAAPRVGEAAARLLQHLRGTHLGVAAIDGPDVVAVLRESPSDSAEIADAGPIGVVGPGRPDDVPLLRKVAIAAARVGAERGRSGLVDAATVTSGIAMLDRPDLATLLLQAHAGAMESLGRQAGPVVATVRDWLESGCDADVAAEKGFVHANTVRNRVAALAEATGLDPRDPFAAIDLWWLCRAWQAGAD